MIKHLKFHCLTSTARPGLHGIWFTVTLLVEKFLRTFDKVFSFFCEFFILLSKFGKKILNKFSSADCTYFSLTLAIYNLKTSLFYVNVIVFIFLQDFFFRNMLFCAREKSKAKKKFFTASNIIHIYCRFSMAGV